jgi:predicted nucleic acid-binding Zn ribbon protein
MIYLYRCEICECKAELNRPVEERNQPIACCDPKAFMTRVYTPPAVTFKGADFYRNDSRK